MKTNRWMKAAILASAVAALTAVVAVLACGPAASERQSSGSGDAVRRVTSPETEAQFVLQQPGDVSKATPTPTPGPGCERRMNRFTEEWHVSCPEPGPQNIEHNLRWKFNEHMSERADRQVRGEPVEVVSLRVIIHTSTEDAVDDVLSYLKDVDTRGPVYPSKGGNFPKGRVSARFSVELLPEVATINGVQLIDKPSRPSGQSLNFQRSPALTAADVVHVDQWHEAGVNGLGVDVALIDTNFFGFGTEVVPSPETAPYEGRTKSRTAINTQLKLAL